MRDILYSLELLEMTGLGRLQALFHNIFLLGRTNTHMCPEVPTCIMHRAESDRFLGKKYCFQE